LEVPPVPKDKLPADVQAALAPLDAALAADPKDQASLVAEATLFEDHMLPVNALQVYYKLREQWPDAVWVKSKVFDLEQTVSAQTAKAAAAAPAGNTYALIVGISKYQKPALDLQFAQDDASSFAQLLESPRGGGVPPDNILLLTDAKATTAALRSGFQDFLKRRAGKNDTVVILIAGHGTVEVPGNKKAFILTYDSDPQDLDSTALPVEELQNLFGEQLSRVGRVILFADVCKAGTIGTIQNTTISSDVQRLGDAQGDLFGLLASRPREVSLEGPQFGGGHGAFTYFVLKGLEGAADDNKDGIVDANELVNYVSDQVPDATGRKQHPREFGTYDDSMRLSDVKKPGIQISLFHALHDVRNGGLLFLADSQTPPLSSVASAALDRFNAALNAGRILPAQPNNAFTALNALQGTVAPEIYTESQNQLRIALENRGQQVLLRYLEGEETPQTRQDFAGGATDMQAARMLTQESLFLEGRQDFFEGRTLLFDKQYPQAVSKLEQAIRFDPDGGYGFNALGIGYLEQGQFNKAIPAFRDAARRAPHWAYPLHNLALAYVETGDYRSAIRAYQDAMKLAPRYSYLPYNLGLVYQRLHRNKQAEASYRKAMMLEPGAPQSYNALGTLKASEGKRADAERLYKQALDRDPKLLAARHNLALLLAGEKGRQAEAIALLRTNLQQSPSYLPSQLSLAEVLASSGDRAGAETEYRRVLAEKPGYIAARVALAGLLEQSGDRNGALTELRQALGTDSQNPDILERIGDVEAASGQTAQARQSYEDAAKLAPDRDTRKRIEKKEKALK
jgi:tetratricopeptide (TPR) repeat protein